MAGYAARRVRDKGGRHVGWGVYQPAPVARLAVGYTGPFAWWRAHLSAASMNRPASWRRLALMAVYRYPLPRGYRRVRYPYRYRKGSTGALPAAVITGAVLLAGAGAGARAAASHGHAKAVRGNPAAAQVTAFARARVGKVPYLWGGTTDAGMDCSGLAQAAYASAGIAIERTSQQQWASERHVTVPVAGDLVFFAGSDGTPSSPGHVGIVTDPVRHLMIDAYATGTYVRYDTYGPAASPGTGLSAVTGFTDPAPGPAPVTGGSEAAFTGAVLAGLGAPATGANTGSLEAWGSREGCWGCTGANNQFDSTLYEPGSTAFNTFGGGLHVWNYPTPAIGAQATAQTISAGYPEITAALRSGSGVCGYGFAAEFSRWSGGGYQEVC